MKQRCYDGPITPIPQPFVLLNQHPDNNDDDDDRIKSLIPTPPFPKGFVHHEKTTGVCRWNKNTNVPVSIKCLYLFCVTFLYISITQMNFVSTFSIRPLKAFVYHYHSLSYHGKLNHPRTRSNSIRNPIMARKTTTTTASSDLSRHMLDDPNQFITTTATAAASAVNIATSNIYNSNINHLLPQLFATYLYYLDHYSLVTQAVTAAFFAGLGDVFAQSISIQQKQIQRVVLEDDRNFANQNYVYNNNNNNSNIDISSSIELVDETSHSATNTAVSVKLTEPSSYDVHRTMHYVIKGLGGGCMWSVWFSYSDPISFDVTQRLLESVYHTIGVPAHTELGYVTFNGEIDVATAASHVLSTQIPFLSVSGCTLQHVIHVAVCILLEQFFVSPLFYSIWDIPIPALLSGSPIRQIPAQIQAKLIPLLIANAKVWTPANVITYSLPSEYRVLFASVTDVIWQTILSDITSNEIILQPPPIPKASLVSSSQDRDNVMTNAENGSTSNGDGPISESILTTAAIPTAGSLQFIQPPLPVSSIGTSTAPTIATTAVFQSNAAQDSYKE